MTIPVRSPWTDEAYLRSVHIVPNARPQSLSDREILARLELMDRAEYAAIVRGAAYGLLLSLAMFVAAVLWCCL